MKALALKALIILCSLTLNHTSTGVQIHSVIPMPVTSVCPGYPHGGGPSGNPCAGNGTSGPTNIPTNATSTDTKDWACIRWNESTNGKYSANIYQFQNAALMKNIGMTYPPGSYSRSEQNTFALKAYAYSVRVWGYGLMPWRLDWGVCGLGS